MDWGRRVGRVSIAVAVSFVALAGCSGESTEQRSGSTTASATSSAAGQQPSLSVVPSVPVYPEAATENDLAGQEAFVRHWFDAYNFGRRTGDTSVVKEISAPTEKNLMLWERVDRIYAASGKLEGNQYHLLDTVRAPADDEGLAHVTVTVKLDPGVEVAADGARTAVDGDEQQVFSMAIYRDGGRWKMLGFSEV